MFLTRVPFWVFKNFTNLFYYQTKIFAITVHGKILAWGPMGEFLCRCRMPL